MNIKSNKKPVSRHSVRSSDQGGDRPPRAGSDLPAERLIRIERRKARNRAISLSVFVMVIMLITMLLILSVMRQARPKPRFIFIQQGTIEHVVEGTALIIRDETIFNSPADGLIKPLVADGSRAARGQKLAMVIPADREDQLAELQKSENDIVSLQIELMNGGKGAGAKAIFDESASSLNPIVNLIRKDIANGTLSNISGYAMSIAFILEQRATKLQSIDFRDARLDTLKAKKSSLESALGLEAGTLICQQPGIVSFRLDGLESQLRPDLALSITVDEFNYHVQTSSWNNLATGQVGKDQPILRIISSLSQQLVFLLPEANASQFPVGDVRSILMPGDALSIDNCRVIRSEDTAAGALIVFETDRRVERLSDMRTFRGELVISATSGLKVPVSALIEHDPDLSEARLMIVSGGYTRSSRVKVVDRDREYAIVQAIDSEEFRPSVSAILVANPDSIEAGEFIGN